MRRVATAALGLLALAAAVLAVLSPTERSHEVVSWSARDANPLAVSLVDPRPARLDAHGSSSGTSAGVVLETFQGDPAMRVEKPSAHLRLDQVSEGLVLSFVGHAGEVLASTAPLASPVGGPWTLVWDGVQAQVATEAGSQTLAAPADRIVVLNWLEATDPSARATITSSGFSLDRPAPSHGLFVVVALLLVLAVLLLSGEVRRPVRPMSWLRAHGRPTAADGFVGAVLISGALVLPPNYDDGWYLARSRLLAASGWSLQTPLSDPYWGGVPNIQGFLYESVLGFTVAQSTIIVVIRLLPLVLLGATWVVLSRFVMPRLGGASWARWVGAGFLGLWAAAFLTLRPEVLIGLLGAVLVAVFPRSKGRLLVLPVVGALGLAGLAVSTHQTGLVLLPVALVAVIATLWRPGSAWLKTAGLASGAALVLSLGFVNQNVTLALENLRGYDALTGHGAGPLDEWLRVAELLRIGTFGQRAYSAVAAAGLAALLCAVVWRWVRRRGAIEDRLLVASILAMPVGLLATSSKWSWHYAALIVPCAVGLVLGAGFVRRHFRATPARASIAALACGAVLVTAWFAAGSYSVPTEWQKPITLLAGALCAVAIGFAWRRGVVGVGGLLSSGLVIVVLGVALAQGAKAANESPTGWSFLAQTTRGIVDPNYRCGAITFTGPVGPPGSPTGAQLVESGVSMTVGPGQYLVNPCTPIWTRNGGLWSPIGYSIEDPNWLLANLPVQTNPPRGCIERSTPDLNGNYQSCVYELLPAESLQADAPGKGADEGQIQ